MKTLIAFYVPNVEEIRAEEEGSGLLDMLFWLLTSSDFWVILTVVAFFLFIPITCAFIETLLERIFKK